MAAFPAIPQELAGYWDEAGFETATDLANAYGCVKEVEEDVASFLGAPGTALAVRAWRVSRSWLARKGGGRLPWSRGPPCPQGLPSPRG